MPVRRDRSPLAGSVACLLIAPCAAVVPAVAGGQSELVIYKEGTNLYHRAGVRRDPRWRRASSR